MLLKSSVEPTAEIITPGQRLYGVFFFRQSETFKLGFHIYLQLVLTLDAGAVWIFDSYWWFQHSVDDLNQVIIHYYLLQMFDKTENWMLIMSRYYVYLFSPLPQSMAQYLNIESRKWHRWCCAKDPGRLLGKRKHSRGQSSGRSARFDRNLPIARWAWLQDGKSAREGDDCSKTCSQDADVVNIIGIFLTLPWMSWSNEWNGILLPNQDGWRHWTVLENRDKDESEMKHQRHK